MLLWGFGYRLLCGHMFAFLLGVYLGVKLLGPMVILCLPIWRIARLFSRDSIRSYTLIYNILGFQFLYILSSHLALNHVLLHSALSPGVACGSCCASSWQIWPDGARALLKSKAVISQLNSWLLVGVYLFLPAYVGLQCEDGGFAGQSSVSVAFSLNLQPRREFLVEKEEIFSCCPSSCLFSF